LGVTRQTKEECKNILDIDIQICRTMEDVKDGINITNYENIDKFDTTKFIGVILDESSILKNFVGKTKVKLAKAFKDTKYKLSLTATPAPNDYLELLNQADFLDIMEAGKALATWFINLFGENIPAIGLYAAFLILVVVLTQFLSNSTVLTIVLPIVFSITTKMGYNTYSFAVGLTIAAAMAVATPLANTTIGMSMVADYKFSDYLKYAGPMTLIAMLILLLIVPVLFPLV